MLRFVLGRRFIKKIIEVLSIRSMEAPCTLIGRLLLTLPISACGVVGPLVSGSTAPLSEAPRANGAGLGLHTVVLLHVPGEVAFLVKGLGAHGASV